MRRHGHDAGRGGLFGSRVSIGHIGDSRCYRLRGGKFEQLTHDHSLLQEQIDSGVLTPEQAKYSLNKNLVTRALGIEAIVPADIAEYRVEAEDIYVLCSDGLTDMVEPDVVQAIVAAKRTDLAEAPAELIDIANQNGGRDNISVVLVRVPPEYLRRRLGAALARQKAKSDPWQARPPRGGRKATRSPRQGAGNDRSARRQRLCLPDTAVSGEHALVVTILSDSFLEDWQAPMDTALCVRWAEGGVVLDQPYARPHEIQAERRLNLKGPRHNLDGCRGQAASSTRPEGHEFRLR